ncbi:hypothetical protein Mapa_003699 [Marchantia paleacea]|nr:hypothetical protein Mapa_003699 [Marchantia paleacea]
MPIDSTALLSSLQHHHPQTLLSPLLSSTLHYFTLHFTQPRVPTPFQATCATLYTQSIVDRLTELYLTMEQLHGSGIRLGSSWRSQGLVQSLLCSHCCLLLVFGINMISEIHMQRASILRLGLGLHSLHRQFQLEVLVGLELDQRVRGHADQSVLALGFIHHLQDQTLGRLVLGIQIKFLVPDRVRSVLDRFGPDLESDPNVQKHIRIQIHQILSPEDGHAELAVRLQLQIVDVDGGLGSPGGDDHEAVGPVQRVVDAVVDELPQLPHHHRLQVLESVLVRAQLVVNDGLELGGSEEDQDRDERRLFHEVELHSDRGDDAQILQLHFENAVGRAHAEAHRQSPSLPQESNVHHHLVVLQASQLDPSDLRGGGAQIQIVEVQSCERFAGGNVPLHLPLALPLADHLEHAQAVVLEKGLEEVPQLGAMLLDDGRQRRPHLSQQSVEPLDFLESFEQSSRRLAGAQHLPQLLGRRGGHRVGLGYGQRALLLSPRHHPSPAPDHPEPVDEPEQEPGHHALVLAHHQEEPDDENECAVHAEDDFVVRVRQLLQHGQRIGHQLSQALPPSLDAGHEGAPRPRPALLQPETMVHASPGLDELRHDERVGEFPQRFESDNGRAQECLQQPKARVAQSCERREPVLDQVLERGGYGVDRHLVGLHQIVPQVERRFRQVGRHFLHHPEDVEKGRIDVGPSVGEELSESRSYPQNQSDAFVCQRVESCQEDPEGHPEVVEGFAGRRGPVQNPVPPADHSAAQLAHGCNSFPIRDEKLERSL